MRYLLLLLLAFSVTARGDIYQGTVRALEFEKLLETFDAGKVDRLLNGQGSELDTAGRRAAAVLISLGALEPLDLAFPEVAAAKLELFREIARQNHPALMGRIGEASLFTRMAEPFNWDELLAGNPFLEPLGEALSKGVLTGYDIRARGIYDGFASAHTLIYSQSSLLHMRQLATLLESESVGGWIYITPKVSAFLFRDDWGAPSDAVVTLPSGARVVQGREIAVMFVFDTRADLEKFHALVTRYAKKDEADEPGLIANAWWQPFYYTDEPVPDFETISLVVVSSGEYEATLTVLEERTGKVVDALEHHGWSARIDRVWVNRPYFRFLNGDFR